VLQRDTTADLGEGLAARACALQGTAGGRSSWRQRAAAPRISEKLGHGLMLVWEYEDAYVTHVHTLSSSIPQRTDLENLSRAIHSLLLGGALVRVTAQCTSSRCAAQRDACMCVYVCVCARTRTLTCVHTHGVAESCTHNPSKRVKSTQIERHIADT